MAKAENTRDVFISYAGEDADKIARPIYEALLRRGVSAWFAESALQDGRSLVDNIGQGLASAGHIILIVSDHFLAKDWPDTEMRTALAMDASGPVKRVHVLLATDWKRVVEKYPLLVDPVHTQWNGDAEDYALRVSRWFGRRAARWFEGVHDENYVGPVWIRLSPSGSGSPVDFRVSVVWGIKVYEAVFEAVAGPLSLTHQKTERDQVQLLVRVEPDAIITIGAGLPLDEGSTPIDDDWNPAKDARTPPVRVVQWAP
jgi:hypothetical protein